MLGVSQYFCVQRAQAVFKQVEPCLQDGTGANASSFLPVTDLLLRFPKSGLFWEVAVPLTVPKHEKCSRRTIVLIKNHALIFFFTLHVGITFITANV